MKRIERTTLLWFLIPALSAAGAIFGWILLMDNIRTAGGSGILLVMMYYTSLPVALTAVWIGLHATEHITSRLRASAKTRKTYV